MGGGRAPLDLGHSPADCALVAAILCASPQRTRRPDVIGEKPVYWMASSEAVTPLNATANVRAAARSASVTFA